MDMLPPHVQEEIAARQMERTVAAYGDGARDHLRAIPHWTITPELFVLILTSLDGMADHLPPSAREIAKERITDFILDMEGCAA